MKRSIVTNKQRLAEISRSCDHFPEHYINEVIQDLKDTATYADAIPPGCLGLAANQLGHPVRVVVIKFGGHWMPLCDPVILSTSGGMDHKKEGCLSVPGKNVRKSRHKKIVVAHNLGGETFKVKYTGMTARVIQHEIDHLNGITI